MFGREAFLTLRDRSGWDSDRHPMVVGGLLLGRVVGGFIAGSGARLSASASLGLRWSDVDLELATAIIARQVTALDHRVIVKDLPKTKQVHLIRLDEFNVEGHANILAHRTQTCGCAQLIWPHLER